MHVYTVEFLNLNEEKRSLTGIQDLRTGGSSNIKIVQLVPDFFENLKCQKSTENNQSI